MALECKILIVRKPTISGSILFSSTPSGADIYLGASGSTPIYTGLQTPNTIPNLPAGDYDYILKLLGYNDYNGTITVGFGETASAIVTLTLLAHPLVPILVSVPIVILILESFI